MNIVQVSLAPLVACGLVAVAMVAALSFMVWMWAMRRPASVAGAGQPQVSTDERPTPIYVALGAHVRLGVDGSGEVGGDWVDMLRAKMPEGTRLVVLGRRDITLAELNQVEISAAVAAKPDIVTLWSVVSDAVRGVALQEYIRELQQTLTMLTRRTEAEVVLLNLPDISLLARGRSGDEQALIRGGVEQWNRAIASAARRFRGRVQLVDVYPISGQLLGGENGRSVLADRVWDALVGRAD